LLRDELKSSVKWFEISPKRFTYFEFGRQFSAAFFFYAISPDLGQGFGKKMILIYFVIQSAFYIFECSNNF